MKENLNFSRNNTKLEDIRRFDFTKNVEMAIASSDNMESVLYKMKDLYLTTQEQVAFTVAYGKYIEKVAKNGGDIKMLKKLKASIEKMFKLEMNIDL